MTAGGGPPWREHVRAAIPPLPIRAKIGVIGPLNLIDTTPYEFYRVAPDDVMFAAIGVGLRDFTRDAAVEALSGVDGAMRQLKLRSVDLVMLNGLPLLVELDDQQVSTFRASAATFAPYGGWTALDACALSIKSLGAERIALASKWSDQLNSKLADRLNRFGIETAASVGASNEMDQIRGDYESGSRSAWDLAHAAIEALPTADAIFLAGAAWLTLHLVDALERDLGIPVITGLQSTNWFALNVIEAFTPRDGHGSLFRTVLDRSLLEEVATP